MFFSYNRKMDVNGSKERPFGIILVGIAHILISWFNALYGILIPKNRWDGLYLVYILTMYLSWTVLNGECLWTLLTKRCDNPAYQAGTNSIHLSDFKEVGMFLGIEWMFEVGENLKILNVLGAVSLYLVMQRNQFPLWLTLGTMGSVVLYTQTLRFFHPNLHEKDMFLFIQSVFKIYFSLVLIYLVWTLMKRII
jgi:hypothetical protein